MPGDRQTDTPERDFYDRLEEEGRRHRREYDDSHRQPLPTDRQTAHLLPTAWDRRRWELDRAQSEADREARQLPDTVRNLVKAAAAEHGREQAGAVAGTEIGIVIEGQSPTEIYVGIRIGGRVDADVTAVILREVPDTEPMDWMPEPTGMPHRHLAHPEVVYSTAIELTANQ